MKTIFIVLSVIAAIVIVLGGIFYTSFLMAGPLATLVIDSGNVQYKSAGDWQDASSGMSLKQDYSVKTLENSAAKIIFSNSVMRLDANTEIALSNLDASSVSIAQIAGKTWSKVLKISGISDYEVSTPDAIATVRGTAFDIEVGNGTKIGVAEGNVTAQVNGTNVQEIIGANMQATINSGDSQINEVELLLDAWINSNIEKDTQYREELKAKLKSKYSFLLNIAKSQNDISDDEVNKLIDEWLDGKISIKKAIADGSIPSSMA